MRFSSLSWGQKPGFYPSFLRIIKDEVKNPVSSSLSWGQKPGFYPSFLRIIKDEVKNPVSLPLNLGQKRGARNRVFIPIFCSFPKIK